jgi:hypothetical protein
LLLLEIDVGPAQRHHLAAAQTGLAAKQRYQRCFYRLMSGRIEQPFVLVEVEEPGGRSRHFQQPNRARHLRQFAPLDRLLQERVQHRQNVVHGLRRAV